MVALNGLANHRKIERVLAYACTFSHNILNPKRFIPKKKLHLTHPI